MAAANKDNGRHQVAENRRQAMANREYKPVEHTTTKLHYHEDAETRRARIAAKTNTRKSLWL